MAKISVVVPIYNVEKYLKKCVDSIVNQTFSDLEIILVDDGAKDSSGQMCDELAKEDSRIKVIHKQNGGLSDARNVGLEKATSEYVLFIDSDDYIALNMVERLYELHQKYNVDMTACGVYNVYSSGEKPQYGKIEEFVCDNIDAYAHILVGKKIPGTICNKLMKREKIKDLRFPVGKLYEDAFFTISLMQNIKKVAVTTEPLYYYFHRVGSITTTSFKKKDMDIVEAYQQTMDLVKEKYPQITNEAEFRLIWAYFTVLDRMLLIDDYKKLAEYPKVIRYLKKHILSVLRSTEFYKTRKIGAIVLFINVRLYRILVLYNNKRNEYLT